MTEFEQELFLTWQAEVNNIGPFAQIEQLQEILEKAPVFAQTTQMYLWLHGFIYGRICEKQEKKLSMMTD